MVNLSKEYLDFIDKCREETPILGHHHHILPKSMNGNDDESNIIFISYDNHKKAHILLAESFDKNTKEYRDNMLAAQLLNAWTSEDVMLNGWSHRDEVKLKMSEIKKNKYEEFGAEYNPFFNKKHKDSSINKISESLVGNKCALKKYKILKNGKEIVTVSGISGIKEFCLDKNISARQMIRHKMYKEWSVIKEI